MSIDKVNESPAQVGSLVGNRVIVRPFRPEDISASYLGWLQDPEIVRFSNQRFNVHTIDSCKAYLASFSCSGNQFLAIFGREKGEALGTITVYRNLHHGTANIGIMIGERSVWGRGLGSEAFCLVLSALESSRVIRKVMAGTLSVNHGMIRIMEKAGMFREATLHAQEILNSEPTDIVH